MAKMMQNIQRYCISYFCNRSFGRWFYKWPNAMYLIFTWIFWEMIQIWPVHNCLEVGNRQGWNKPPQRIQILAGHPNWEFFKKNCHAIFELVFFQRCNYCQRNPKRKDHLPTPRTSPGLPKDVSCKCRGCSFLWGRRSGGFWSPVARHHWMTWCTMIWAWFVVIFGGAKNCQILVAMHTTCQAEKKHLWPMDMKSMHNRELGY